MISRRPIQLLWLLALVLLLILYIPLKAQYTDQYYLNYGLEDGLPSNNTYCVDQDSKGNIWIGTQAGIVKFNGYEFETFGSNEGLYQNEVIDAKIDSKDRIWLNTTGPPCYIQNDSVHYIQDMESPNIAWNFDMKEDFNGDVWLGCEYTIYHLDGDDLSILKSFKIGALKGHILGGKEKAFYIYTGKEILKYTGRHIQIDTLEYSELLPDQIFNKSNSYFRWPYIYYTHSKSLYYFDILSGENATILEDAFLPYTFSIQGDYLLGLTHSGLLIYEFLTKKKVVDKPLGLFAEETIGAIKLDKNDNLWIPTYRSGLLLLKPISNKIIREDKRGPASNAHLESLAFDNIGTLWIGTEDGRLLAEKNGSWHTYSMPKSKTAVKRILDLDPFNEDDLLITGDMGIYTFINEEFSEKFNAAAKKSSIANGMVMSSTYKNVFTTSLEHLTSISPTHSIRTLNADTLCTILKDQRSYANAFGNEDELWFATEKEGIVQIKNGTATDYAEISKKLKSSINEIISLDNNVVAVASSGAGVFLIEEYEIQSITTEQGLSSDVVHCLVANQNKLYAGTNKGLNIITFDENFVDYTIEIIDESSGLATDEIHGIAYRNDTTYLATHKGLLRIDDSRESTVSDKQMPTIQINEVLVNNEQKSGGEEIVLESFENSMKIKFMAIDVINSKHLRYAYRLRGFADEWIKTSSRETHYSNLPSGKYVFQVASVIENKILEDITDSVEIVIKQKFSESIWLKILLGFFTIGLFFVANYFYTTRAQKARLSQLVAQRTRELDEKMAALEVVNKKLEISNESIRNYAYIASHDLKSPLRTVGSFVQLLSKKNAEKFDAKDKEYVRIATQGVTNMSNTIDDILAYGALEKEEPSNPIDLNEVIRSVIVDLSVSIKEKSADVIMVSQFPKGDGHRIKLKRLFQNLIENGLKYNESEDPLIEINVKGQAPNLTFSVKDNGIGIDPRYSDKIFKMFQRLHSGSTYSGTGIGLAMCSKIVESYGGTIWVEKNPESGSTFNFTLPHFFGDTSL